MEIFILLCFVSNLFFSGLFFGLTSTMGFKEGLIGVASLCLSFFLYFNHVFGENIELEKLKDRAVEERAAVWSVDPDTGERKFKWVSEVFEEKIK